MEITIKTHSKVREDSSLCASCYHFTLITRDENSNFYGCGYLKRKTNLISALSCVNVISCDGYETKD